MTTEADKKVDEAGEDGEEEVQQQALSWYMYPGPAYVIT